MRTRLGNGFNTRAGNSARVIPAAFVLLALLVIGLAACGESSQPTAQPAEPPAPAASPATQPTAESASPAEQPQVDGPVPTPSVEFRPSSSPTAPASQPVAAEAEATSAPQVTDVPASQPEPASETGADAAQSSTSAPEPTSEPESPATEATGPEAEAGTGFVIGEGSEATFTVNEKLAWLDLPNDAVMRTKGITGTIYLDGRPSVIELDLHSMTSDSERRDGYVRNRMFPDDRTATFTVTSLGDLPNPLPEGEEISREVQGELSIKGVAKPITFQVQARRDPGKLFVLGRTTFAWQDLEIPPPNIPGRIQVKDEVQVEALLSAVPNTP